MKYLINNIAKLMGISTNAVRYYEKKGIIHSERDRSNYRWYSDFDIIKISAARLCIKCGFSHEQIQKMLGSSDSDITDIWREKLSSIDRQLENLKRMRHWLKDNIQLMNTLDEIGDGYYIMECPEVKYIVYSKGGELLCEPDRLKSIKTLVYDAPEIQLIEIFGLEHIKRGSFVSRKGWAIKEMDISKFGLEDFVNDNGYIMTYPKKKCLYYTMKIPSEYGYDRSYMNKKRAEYFEKASAYAKSCGMNICGDIMEFIVSALGTIWKKRYCLFSKTLSDP